ncbi:phage tail protein [Providencia sp. SKLX074055]|uniref:phage tail-collar fiber domain-containing protein n=1 Tax=Providencia xihuensis TaxID=3342830 RepID=UPI0035C24E98
MASVITVAFENWKAQEAASGKAVLLDEFVFANVPNLDPTQPIDRNEKLPPANQIVHRQAVNKAGLASENAVAYSVTLGAEVGNFDFNWIGLLNKASGTVAMITHAPIQKKLKTQNGQQGNVLTRSFILEFQGAAEETQIKTSAETWQIDFTARLSGIDEIQRLINVDSYGAAAFFNDGFEVTRSGEQYMVKKGLGYVGGLRGELAQNQILNGLRNTKIYADFSYQGNIVSQWNTVVKITSAATLNNYVDAAGFTHQTFAIASIDASGNVKDLRSMGALSSQEISALETRLKLDLSKKIDKANITSQTGNSTELVVNQQLLTTELGKKQPAGDYATNAALTNGLNGKFDKKGGVINGHITSAGNIQSNSGKVTSNLEGAAGIQLDGTGEIAKIRGKSIANRWYDHILPEKSGTLAHIGDFGFGVASYELAGIGELNETMFIQYGSTLTAKSDGFPGAGGGVQVSYQSNKRAQLFINRNPLTLSYRFSDVAGKDIETPWIDTLSTSNTIIDRNGYIKTITATELSDYPVGAPIPWPHATAPSGFLVCNGQSFNKATYPLLASAYPSGVLPDLRAEFIRGLDASRGVDNSRTVLSNQSDAMRKITGENIRSWASADSSIPTGAFAGSCSNKGAPGTGQTPLYEITFDSSRVVPTANEFRPRNIAFLYIVRAA